MTWVLVILIWSWDGSAYEEHVTYTYETQTACEYMLGHIHDVATWPSNAEFYCEPGKYYPRGG